MSEAKLVRIRFLKYCGRWAEGEEIEVDEATAATLCAKRERSDGEKIVSWQNAIRISDLQAAAKLPPDLGGLSLDEARAMGIKNIAIDPNGPGPIEPKRDEASFSEIKGIDEGESAKLSLELNKKNPRSRKAAS